VRLADIEDLDALRDVYRLASLSNEHDRPNLLAHPGLLELDPAGVYEGRTIAAIDQGAVVGFATFSHHSEHVELEALFVDPNHRRRGHAMRLVDEVVDVARRAGVARVEVTANDHASAFYDAAGFLQVGLVDLLFGPVPRKHLAV
jgi:ribosomal protein S18 acetylase RimI-like enzyme